MKIIQTLDTRQWRDRPIEQFRGGWIDAKCHWYSWVLSVNQARKIFGNVHLVSDTAGAGMLDRLGLRFDSVTTAIDGIAADPSLWSYAKIKTYSLQREAFMHVDSDVYLWKPLPEEITSRGTIFQDIERPMNHSHYGARKTELDSMPVKPTNWQEIGATAYNMGIFSTNDLEAVKRYVADVDTLLQSPENRTHWQQLGNLHRFNWFMEQGTIAASFPAANEYGYIFQEGEDREAASNRLGYTHMMGWKNGRDADSIQYRERLESRIKRDYPEQYRIIEEMSRQTNAQTPTGMDSQQDTPILKMQQTSSQKPSNGCGCSRAAKSLTRG